MKRIIHAVITIAIAMVVLCACDNSSERQSVYEEEIRIAANNMQNPGAIATDGDWLYYNGEDGLYQVHLDSGTECTRMTGDADLTNLFLYIGNKLYYKGSGTPRYWNEESRMFETLQLNSFVDRDCFQTDGEYYYVNKIVTDSNPFGESAVFCVNANDINDYTKLADIYASKLILHGDYLYIMSNYIAIGNEDNPYKGTWRIDLNGENPTKILDSCPEYFIVTEDKIYYSEDGVAVNADDYLCSMNLDGSEKYVYPDVRVGAGLNVIGEYIVYVDYETKTIHRMNMAGTENVVLNDNKSFGVFVADNWLVYKNIEDNYKYYKMNFDGTINSPITENSF